MTLKRSLKVIQTGTIRKIGCGFLFAFHSNYGSILHYSPDKARYWSKIVIIFHTPLHSMPPLEGPRSNIAITCGTKKTKMVGLPDGEKNFEDMCSRLGTIPACDRRTDRRADILPWHSLRYAYASRGKNEMYMYTSRD